MPEPKLCWVVTDGRRGIENQALGLAEAVGRLIPLAIERRIAPKPPLVFRAAVKLADLTRRETEKLSPSPLRGGGRGWGAKIEERSLSDGPPDASGPPTPAPPPQGGRGSPIAGPHLWIACGRASLPYSERARSWFQGRAFVVQVQNPKRPLDSFDLVVPPLHDEVKGPNIFSILGSPNRIDRAQLEDRLAAFEAAPDAAPRPRATVLIGGDSKRHRFTPAVLEALLDALDRSRTAGWSLLVTTSRRTPEFAVRALRGRFSGAEHVRLWTDDSDGPNPYDAFLAAADVVLVTKDSTNMITEAASAGKPVLLLPMEGEDGKFAALYAALEQRGNAKPYAGDLSSWPVEPLVETERAAAEIVRRLEERSRGA